VQVPAALRLWLDCLVPAGTILPTEKNCQTPWYKGSSKGTRC
jgi:hypothetical protein